MRGSIQLCRIGGISVKIHLTFLILPLLFGYLHGAKGVVFIFFVFISVALHELMHSFQARHHGIAVEQIVLLPIGGVASMRRVPETPREEFFISIAGPLFNFVLAAVLFAPIYMTIGRALFRPSLNTWPETVAYIFWVNPWLGFFNLLPAFPMDGGRILRAFLATRMDYLKATKLAVSFGHGFALLFAFLGLVVTPNLMLAVIALFIYIAASQEEIQVDIRMTLKGFHVRQIISSDYVSVTPLATLGEVIEHIFHTHQEDFPVVEGGRLVGLLTRTEIIAHMRGANMNLAVGALMRRSFPTIGLDDSLIVAQQRMEEHSTKAVPVLNEGKLAGIVSLEDISRIYSIMSATT